MNPDVTVRIIPRFLGAAILGAALSAGAVPLDLDADAVLGKASLASPSGGAASATNLLSSGQLAEDPVSGALWVTDFSANRVLRFSSAAAFADGEAANLVLGQASFTATAANRGGAAGANTLSAPVGVAVDQTGRVYVSDAVNNRILVYRPPHASGMDATWVIGQANFLGAAADRGGATAANTLHGPRDLALGATGNLFVADSANNRILKFDAPAITGALASRVFGQAVFTTNAAATTASGLSFPRGLAVDLADNLWVAEELNHRVLRYDDGAAAGDTTADLVLCQSLFTTANVGTTAYSCNTPVGVAVDHEGVVYVSDYGNSRVLRFTTFADGAAATAVVGQPDLTSGQCNQGLASPGATTLCNPFPPALDRAGNLLVPDYANGRVLRYDLPRARTVPTVASLSPAGVPQGSGVFTITVNGNGFYQGSVVNWGGSPRATAFISGKRLLAQIPASDIASGGFASVSVTNPAPGGGTSGLLEFNAYARAPLDATADRVLGQPNFTGSADLNPQVGEEQLGPVNSAATSQDGMVGAAIDRNSGRLFVSDPVNNSRVLSWPSVTAFYNAQPADVVFGQPDEFSRGCNAGGLSAASLCFPNGLAVDPAGALYVSDTSNDRVLRYLPPFSTGMAATRVFGQGGSFTTDATNYGGLGANGLNAPRGLAVNGGSLFVHDSGNFRILVYNAPNADTTADVVIGQPDMASALEEPPSATRIVYGDGFLALDATGRLHFGSNVGNRILRFSPPFANGMAADLVIGQADFISTAPATSASGLSSPMGIAFDPAGNLLVAEFYNHRVVRYAAPLASSMAATGILGQADFVTATSGTSATKLFSPTGIAVDATGNLIVVDYANARILAFDQPFAFTVDPAGDQDGDGIPNAVEVTEGRDAYAKDNDVFGNSRLFAMQQYRDFLSREGDPDGITAWAGLVAAGTYSRPQAIDAFLSSQEFAGLMAPMVRLYFATFDRVPDYSGLTHNAGLVRAGTLTLVQLADFFATGPEFVASHGDLDNTQYVTFLYQNVLGRAPDSQGLAAWVNVLDTGGTRGQVLLGFSDSGEYQAAIANKTLVTMMYVGMLRRTPELAGFQAWVDVLVAGTWSREQVINGFFLSTEYHNRFLP